MTAAPRHDPLTSVSTQQGTSMTIYRPSPPSTPDPEPPTPAPSDAAPKRSRRRIQMAVVASLAVGVLATGSVFGLNAMSAHAAQQDAIATTKAAVHTLAVAEISNQSAKVDLDGAITSAQQYSASIVPIVAAAPAYLDAGATAVLEQARLALDAAVVTAKTADPEHPDIPAASTTYETPKVNRILPKAPTTFRAKQMTRELTAAAVDVDQNTAAKRFAIDTLTAAHEPIDTALRDVGNLVVTTNANAVRAATPNIDKAALEQAVTTLQITIDDADPLVPAINGYVAAAKTILDAQTAFNTQAAIDAANAAGNDTFVDPSTGESKPNPNYDGGSGSGGSSGGGSGSGGSGSGDSGSGGGGGSAPAAPTPPRVVYGSSSCSGDGGYSEVSYSNRGIVVPGSGVASYNGPYDSGSGWRMDWTCA